MGKPTNMVIETEHTPVELVPMADPKGWRVSESPSPAAMSVYASRRPPTVDLVEGLFLIAVGLVFLIVFTDSHDLSSVDASIFAPLLGLILVGVGANLLLRRLWRANPPLYRLDETGFECSRGLVPWQDVDEIEMRKASGATIFIGLRLRPGARLAKGSMSYASSSYVPTAMAGPPVRLIALGPASLRGVIPRFFAGPIRDT